MARHRFRHIITLLATALLTCMGSVAAHPAGGIYIESLNCLDGRFGLRLPQDLRKLRQLAPALREEVLETQQWQGYFTQRRRLHFDGLVLEVHGFSNDPSRYQLAFAAVWGAQWGAISPFKVSRPVAEAAAVLGAYAADNPGLSRPYEDEGNRLTIHSVAGVVTQVVYECYPD